MLNKPRPLWKHHRGFIGLLISVIFVGLLLRFGYLDQKLFWHDEVTTAYRVGGHTSAEFMADIYTGQVISSADILRFQRLHPQRSALAVIDIFMRDNTQHPPLYYVLLHYWARAWGDSVAHLRSCSAVLSVMALPALYWLCLELFALPLMGWVAIAMMAVSPFHLLYAQEARQYSLWLVLILSSTAMLIRALRVNRWQSWVAYAITLTLSFYTFLFSIFVAISHGLYVGLSHGRRVGRAYGLALGASVLGFSPWLWQTIMRLDQVQASTQWTHSEQPLTWLIRVWQTNMRRLFFDWGVTGPAWGEMVLSSCFTLASLLALWYVWKHTSRQVWLLVFLLMGTIPLCLIGMDLVTGGMRSAIARYFMPSYAGLGLVWAYGLTANIEQAEGTHQRIWKGVTMALLIAGLVSCLHLLPAQYWWNKGIGAEYPRTAALINQATRPLVVSSIESLSPPNLVAFTYYLDPNVKLQLMAGPQLPELPSDVDAIFLLQPSAELRSRFLETYPVQITPINALLWELQQSPEPLRNPSAQDGNDT